MLPQDNGMQRRDFIRSGLAAAGMTALATAPTQAQPPANRQIPLTEGIPTRPFGKTGHVLPILGMGGSAMVMLFSRAYGVPLLSMDERVAMVRHAYDQGIRYFDTARVYGESERIMGQGLKGVRDNVYLATKFHLSKPEAVRSSVEKSLKELDTSYVDCVQIHSPAIEALGADGAMKIHAELVKLRDEKMLRFIGLTTHVAFEDVYKMIDTQGFDQVLLAYGYFRRGMTTVLSNPKIEWRDSCIARAHELGMAIVAMKVMGANIFSHNSAQVVPDADKGLLKKLPAAAIRWVTRDERIAMLNIGCSMPSDIDENVATVKGDLTYSLEDRRILADFSARAYESEVVKSMQVS